MRRMHFKEHHKRKQTDRAEHLRTAQQHRAGLRSTRNQSTRFLFPRTNFRTTSDPTTLALPRFGPRFQNHACMLCRTTRGFTRFPGPPVDLSRNSVEAKDVRYGPWRRSSGTQRRQENSRGDLRTNKLEFLRRVWDNCFVRKKRDTATRP